jgi:hypothetical protein
MANMSDPRVPLVIAHADHCIEERNNFLPAPPLPENLKDLSGIDLSGADLLGVNLRNANLTNSNLQGVSLFEAELSGADISGADLTDAKLQQASIGFADLAGAKIKQSQLKRAVYRDVALDGYPKEVAEKVILFHEPEPEPHKRKLKKRLVVELRSDGKLYIKTSIFFY